ncbi:MAG: exodeoxyribonuclease III [Holosporales bacterium]|jgi:exodeoxyribonuclease-3|nr:exodeoxyribonuclease III [Holosporales bacterium]
MRIATWNVNSVRVRVSHLAKMLINDEIDVILLQELKCVTQAFPKGYFEDLGYNCVVFGQKTYNGVAILSKYLVEDIRLGSDIFNSNNEARYVEAFIKGYKIASVYVPNGQGVSLPAYTYKLNFLENLINYLKNEIEYGELIIGGDFNIARSDIDVYNPDAWRGKVCCTNKERELFESLLEIGLSDCYRLIFKSGIAYTWWDYRHLAFAKNYGLRLDYLLTTKNIRVKNCYVNLDVRAQYRPSDHAPVIMDVE